jgi:hypothetical protein
MNLVRRYLSFLILILSLPVVAQKYDDDAAVWLNINLEKKLNDHFGIHLSQQNRIGNNASEYTLGYGDLGLSYSYNKHVKVMLDYVYGKRRRLDGTYRNRQMIYFALILKKKFGSWTILYRNRIQAQSQELQPDDYGVNAAYYERNKLTLKYEINKRFEAYLFEELYYPLYQAKGKGLDRSRSGVGLNYTINKKSGFEFYFLYQHELNARNRPERLFVYGIGYNHEF